MMGTESLIGNPVTAYDCTKRSNVVYSYSLQDPNACATSDGNAVIETTVYGENFQMKAISIIPIFRCQVIEQLCLSTVGTGHQQV